MSTKRGVPASISLSPAAIWRRKEEIVLQGGGPETLIASEEKDQVELICAMAEFRRCLTTSEASTLCDSSLVVGTKNNKETIE